ncbi:MAG: hypothetical protein QXF59_05635 [Candidatus Bathyarchaeia archaeon]|nr:hypothetical protein [Candidatus Bathyarchaeota archaeon]
MSQRDSADKTGHIAGLIVFFLGIALLAFTFCNGLLFLMYPERLADFAKLIPQIEVRGQPEDPFSSLYIIMTRIAAYLIPALLLLVLGYIASRITMHGIQMYRTKPQDRIEAARE